MTNQIFYKSGILNPNLNEDGETLKWGFEIRIRKIKSRERGRGQDSK